MLCLQNFEKITHRVQSKNKDQVNCYEIRLYLFVDSLFSTVSLLFRSGINLGFAYFQVRHYYYRLVRRMNKLLGPGLCLDAKNSKDTNAAMLRW